MAVRSFLRYALEVPDQAVGQRYYEDFGCAWQPRDFPGEDSLYIWGPPVPDDFGENKEVA